MNTIYDSSLLLVDDNEDLCRMLTDMLCREGFGMWSRQEAVRKPFFIFRWEIRNRIWLFWILTCLTATVFP